MNEFRRDWEQLARPSSNSAPPVACLFWFGSLFRGAFAEDVGRGFFLSSSSLGHWCIGVDAVLTAANRTGCISGGYERG